MSGFPRANVGGISVPRLIIGSNWFMGYSHCTDAKDDYLHKNVKERKKIADILEVFINAGVDAVMGQIASPPLAEAVKEAEDRTGHQMIVVSTPGLPVTPKTPVVGFDIGELERILDKEVNLGATFCMPHTSSTDMLLDICTREVRKMPEVVQMIRERNMIPGLSTHRPETIACADESGLDVETYISIFNSAGFLMACEVDWTARIIHHAKKPVMTIKPMAAGQIRPFEALTFAWNAIRDCDMITAGTMSPAEASEIIELSLSILERRTADVKLQETRSKSTVKSGLDTVKN